MSILSQSLMVVQVAIALLLSTAKISSQTVASNVADQTGQDVIQIMHCCLDGQDLEKPNTTGNPLNHSLPKCIPGTDPWKPLIYSPEASIFIDQPSHWQIVKGVQPVCGPNSSMVYVPPGHLQSFVLLEYGEVILNQGNGDSLKSNEFCLGTNSLLGCVNSINHQAATSTRPKLLRCCGENASFENNSCTESEDGEDKNMLLNVSQSMDMQIGFPLCSIVNNYTIIGHIKDSQLWPNGSLDVDGIHIPAESFCVERIKEHNHQGNSKPFKIFACLEHAAKGFQAPVPDIRFTLYPLGLIISAVFLACTLATGCLLPASHHVLHWRCQTHHVACLMLGDIFMAVIQLAGSSLQGEHCKIFAVMAHFFFLATFFWLNTMCFNIWWTFRDLRPASLEKSQELLRLRFYAAYAWGGPLMIAGSAALIDHFQISTDLRPRFGEGKCWFNGEMEILAYFYGPIGVLLAINLLFFAATARELTCGLWKGEFVKSTTERAALGKVCLKLVVVMGVPWIFDIISWLLPSLNIFWYITDLLNAVQGVFIFVVVGCQPQVRVSLKKRLWSRNPRTKVGRQKNGSSTTQGIPSLGDSSTQNPSTKTAPLETIC